MIPVGSPIHFRADISSQMPRQRKPYTIIEDCLLVPKNPLFPSRARDRSQPVVIKNLVGSGTFPRLKFFFLRGYYSLAKERNFIVRSNAPVMKGKLSNNREDDAHPFVSASVDERGRTRSLYIPLRTSPFT